jgi:release factor glutamine methyltransferase
MSSLTERNVADPDLSHIKSDDYMDIYEPGDDTYLLMTAFDHTLRPTVQAMAKPSVFALEIGPGSGVISSHANNLINSIGVQCVSFAIDINPKAAAIARQTLKLNKNLGDVIIGSLSSSIEDRLNGQIDLLIFNPPYVPSPPEEMNQTDVTAAWAGGVNGREVIDQFLPCIPRLLSQKGVLYLVLIEANKPNEVVEILEKLGISSEIVESKLSVRESLVILLCRRKN